MVLPKSTVHISRFAGTALKSFTHGYAQTVVAASQSSYASQNTQVAPLASNFLSKFGQSNRSQEKHARHGTLASTQSKQDLAHHESGLTQYYDAWHKQQKTDTREWQQFQFAKRIGWQPPSVIPRSENQQAEIAETESIVEEPENVFERDGLKRSYSTSAVNDFAKAIDNEAAEAVAFAQVNEAIAEEVEKSRQDAEKAARSEAANAVDEAQSSSSPQASLSEAEARSLDTPASSVSDVDAYSLHLEGLFQAQQYAQIPAAFEAMLRAGNVKPSQLAYRALLSSAIKLTPNKHQQAPRVLEVYSDMLRRKVNPDAETYALLLDVLATRSLDAAVTSKDLVQKATRYAVPGSGNKFLFRSDEMEHAVLNEDQSLGISLKIFQNASATTTLPSKVYEALIRACAEKGRLADMIHVYGTMETHSIIPHASIFPAMIQGFAAVGDLRNAVECYDEYKSLAVANNEGLNTLVRMDNEVYASLVKAYGTCERMPAAQRFLKQIEIEEPIESKRQEFRDTISLRALIPLELEAQRFNDISALVNGVSPTMFTPALELIATTTADQNNVVESMKAFDALAFTGANLTNAAMAVVAMHVRSDNIEAAEPYWRALESFPVSQAVIDPTVMRSSAIVLSGQILRGLRSARSMFGRVREAERVTVSKKGEVFDRIEEAIEVLGRQTATAAASPLPLEASTELLRMMLENNSLNVPFTESTLGSMAAQQIMQLAPADLDLFTQVQARLILDESVHDVAGPARFALLLDTIVTRGVLPDVTTENLIEKTLVNLDRNDLSRLWNSYRYPAASGFMSSAYPPSSPFPTFASPPAPPAFDNSIDPYAARTDNKGSLAITDLLEKGYGRPTAILNDAMTKFRNIRRAGRHPRFFAYSKLINAAAKENQFDTCNEIVEMAKQDVPFLPQFRVVHHGWVAILDSILAACLMTGRRELAAQYHSDLLEIGSAPSANTFGLYITTLKENTQTFDEASEAVKIFLRSKAEGVEPSSFLYNALIGKLGKARRIDDCLFYFAEMRNLGIRPTSVTYGTIVNALCRVSDEKFAEEIFEEMESCANYKPRPAPYHSLMQYFLTTKRDRSKVLAYYERMRSRGIEPTMHTYKLLIDAHAALEPIDMESAEAVLGKMRAAGGQPEAIHYSSLIHAKGCVLHDMAGARKLFDSLFEDTRFKPQACVYQALFESLVANREIAAADTLLAHLRSHRIELTPYIANALIHGWTLEKNLGKAKEAFDLVKRSQREPSTYEAMVRAYMAVEDREGAAAIVREALNRGYPAAVAGKIADLVGGGHA